MCSSSRSLEPRFSPGAQTGNITWVLPTKDKSFNPPTAHPRICHDSRLPICKQLYLILKETRGVCTAIIFIPLSIFTQPGLWWRDGRWASCSDMLRRRLARSAIGRSHLFAVMLYSFQVWWAESGDRVRFRADGLKDLGVTCLPSFSLSILRVLLLTGGCLAFLFHWETLILLLCTAHVIHLHVIHYKCGSFPPVYFFSFLSLCFQSKGFVASSCREINGDICWFCSLPACLRLLNSIQTSCSWGCTGRQAGCT